MSDQGSLDLKGRTEHPAHEEARTHPTRAFYFRVRYDSAGNVYADILDELGEPTGASTGLSLHVLSGSRRWRPGASPQQDGHEVNVG